MNAAGDLQSIFDLQRQQALQCRKSSYADRVELLNKLEKSIAQHRPSIYQALMTDLNKSEIESDLTEMLPVLKELHYVKRKLRSWMSTHRVGSPLALLGTRSFYQYEPKGVCLIISPWNYPINLTLGPLVAALAAGNTVIIKPSERSPACSEILKQIIASAFQPAEVTVFIGDGSSVPNS